MKKNFVLLIFLSFAFISAKAQLMREPDIYVRGYFITNIDTIHCYIVDEKMGYHDKVKYKLTEDGKVKKIKCVEILELNNTRETYDKIIDTHGNNYLMERLVIGEVCFYEYKYVTSSSSMTGIQYVQDVIEYYLKRNQHDLTEIRTVEFKEDIKSVLADYPDLEKKLEPWDYETAIEELPELVTQYNKWLKDKK